MATNSENIRKYLVESYSDQEFDTFCFDHFRDVYDSFGTGMAKRRKIQDLIEYCERHKCIPKLMTELKQDRPDQYREWFRDEVAEPKGDSAPPETDHKQRESRSLTWAVYVIVTVIVIALGAAALCYLFPPQVTVALKTDHAKYAAVTDVYGTWRLKAIPEDPDVMSRFVLLCQKDGTAAFRFGDRFVSARDNADSRDWELRAEVTQLEAWEKFQLFDPDTRNLLPCRQVLRRLYLDGDGVSLALKTAHRRWVTAMGQDKDWVLRAETTELKDYEKFVVTKAPRLSW